MTALAKAFGGLDVRLRKLIMYYYGLYLGVLYCVLFYLVIYIIREMDPSGDPYWQPAMHKFAVSYIGLFCWAWLSIGFGFVMTWYLSKSEPTSAKYFLRIAAIAVPVSIYYLSAPLIDIALKLIWVLSVWHAL